MDIKKTIDYELLKEFYDKIKEEVRNTGRSNVILVSRIKEIIEQFEDALDEK